MAYCFRHTDTVAVSRCHNCLKPLCSDCIVNIKDHKFCSADCGKKYFQFKEKKEKHLASSRFYRVRNLVFRSIYKIATLVIIAILIYIIYTRGWIGTIREIITGWMGAIYETITNLL